jgi:hypothetical protein
MTGFSVVSRIHAETFLVILAHQGAVALPSSHNFSQEIGWATSIPITGDNHG